MRTFQEKFLIEDINYLNISKIKGNKELFYDSYRNNLLVFDPYEDAVAEEVVDFTHHLALHFLGKKLSKGTDMVVYWSKQSLFARSEFIIFYDFDVSKLKRAHHATIVDVLKSSIIGVDEVDSRFQFVKDDILTPCKIKNSIGEFIT